MTDHVQDDLNGGIMRCLYVQEYLLIEVFHYRQFPDVTIDERLIHPYAETAVDRVNRRFRSGPVFEQLEQQRDGMVEMLVKAFTGDDPPERPKLGVINGGRP